MFTSFSKANIQRTSLLAGLIIAGLSSSAGATEAEIRDKLYEQSATVCVNHTRALANAALAVIPGDVLALIDKRKMIICPSPRLGKDLAVVWYGKPNEININTIVWNPDINGAVDLLGTKLKEMARDDRFPGEVLPWKPDGSLPPKGIMVPGLDYAVNVESTFFDHRQNQE